MTSQVTCSMQHPYGSLRTLGQTWRRHQFIKSRVGRCQKRLRLRSLELIAFHQSHRGSTNSILTYLKRIITQRQAAATAGILCKVHNNPNRQPMPSRFARDLMATLVWQSNRSTSLARKLFYLAWVSLIRWNSTTVSISTMLRMWLKLLPIALSTCELLKRTYTQAQAVSTLSSQI